MENPVKAAFSVGLIARTAVVLIIIFAITDLIGFKDVILAPVSWWNNRKTQ